MTHQDLGLFFGLGVGGAAVVLTLALVVGLARASATRQARLRAEGTVCRAMVRQITNYKGAPGLILAVETPAGVAGRSFGNLQGRGYDFREFAEALALGRAIEVLVHPDIDDVLIKDARTGEFR